MTPAERWAALPPRLRAAVLDDFEHALIDARVAVKVHNAFADAITEGAKLPLTVPHRDKHEQRAIAAWHESRRDAIEVALAVLLGAADAPKRP